MNRGAAHSKAGCSAVSGAGEGSRVIEDQRTGVACAVWANHRAPLMCLALDCFSNSSTSLFKSESHSYMCMRICELLLGDDGRWIADNRSAVAVARWHKARSHVVAEQRQVRGMRAIGQPKHALR